MSDQTEASNQSNNVVNQSKDVKSTPHKYTYSTELGSRLLLAARRRAAAHDEGANAPYRRLGCLRGCICEENDAICKDGTVKTSRDGPIIQVLPVGHVMRPAERWCIDDATTTDNNITLKPSPVSSSPRYFPETIITVVNLDTISAALSLISLSDTNNDTVALSFANDEVPGGYYRAGARAQEEDLCCSIPELYWTLTAEKGLNYPIPPGTALLSRDLYLVRSPKNYDLLLDLLPSPPTTPHQPPLQHEIHVSSSAGGGTSTNTTKTTTDDDRANTALSVVENTKCPRLSIITAAMPRGLGDKRPAGGFMNPNSEWHKTVTRRIQSVLFAAKASGKKDVVLGAFGAGAFGNPPKYVAEAFKQVLQDTRFKGCFHQVVFAIIDPMGTGNLKPFIDSFTR